MSRRGEIFGLVQPLWDVTATVDQEFLDRYGLKANDGILAGEQHKEIYEELLNGSRFEVKYSPGCVVQNALRVAQWYLKEKHATTIVGCVGGDKVGQDMKQFIQSEGIRTEYLVDRGAATGICAVLVNKGANRSLVTRLDAANKYKHSHLVSERVWKLVEDSSYYYLTCFMLNVSAATILTIGEHAARENKCFVMNLSAPYISSLFKEPMQKVLPYCDIVIGNSEEAVALAENFGFQERNLHDIIRRMAELPKVNSLRARIVMITQQDNPIVVCKDGKVKEYPVIPISSERIVDTNGAGDAFVGGFLAHYVLGKCIDDCVQNGIEAAHMIIQVSGCTLPKRRE